MLSSNRSISKVNFEHNQKGTKFFSYVYGEYIKIWDKIAMNSTHYTFQN